jgi:hypothetical protein
MVARHQPALVLEQQHGQREFAVREHHGLVVELGREGGLGEAVGTELQHILLGLRVGAAQQRGNACLQLGHADGLDDEVIGPQFRPSTSRALRCGG